MWRKKQAVIRKHVNSISDQQQFVYKRGSLYHITDKTIIMTYESFITKIDLLHLKVINQSVICATYTKAVTPQ